MEQKLVTIAIHKQEKANIAKSLLEQYGIKAVLEEMSQQLPQGDISLGYKLKVREDDVSKAINLISSSKQLSYAGEGVFKQDDGRIRVLVAVDFSEYSLKACETAFEVAKSMNGKVKILNVFPNMRYPLHMPFADVVRGDESNNILDQARRNMFELCEKINDKIASGEIPSVNYSYSLREGIVEEEIEDYVDEYKPAMLVVGFKGMGNNPQSFIGNVTADIIEITNVPVLAVPLKGRIKNISDVKHLGYLTNVDKRDLESFDHIVKLIQSRSDIRITLIHINKTSKGDRFNKNQLADMHEYFQTRYPELHIGYEVIDSEDIIGSLENFVVKEDVGILCLNTRKRNILGRIFIPSMSRKLLKSIDIHLLVLRN